MLKKAFWIIILILCQVLPAQDFEIGSLERKAKQKYLRNSTKMEYRYRDDTVISDNEKIDGNIIVVKGNLTVYGEVDGDILVLYGNLRIKDSAYINGNATTVDGRIYQDRNSSISGNQIETRARNLYPDDDWDEDYNDDNYSRGYDIEDEDWNWRHSRRYYGNYGTLPFRDIDEHAVVRYNRVQGLFIGPRVPKVISGKYNYFTMHGFAGYGFREEKWRYELGLDRWLFNQRQYRFEIGAQVYDLTDSRDEWLLSTHENSLAAFFLKDDYHDFYRRTGYEVHINQNFTIFLKGTLAYRNDDYASLSRHANWSLFNGDDKFPENPAINEGNMRSIYGQIYLDTRDNIDLPRQGWFALLAVETSSKNNLKSDFSFNQYTLEVRRYQHFGYKERLDMRLKIGSAEGTLPVQKLYQIGGVSTLRGYGYKSFAGDRMILANFEYNINPRIFSTDLFFLDDLSYILFYDIGYAWNTKNLDAEKSFKWHEGFSHLQLNDMKSDIGMAFALDDGNIRFSLAKRLDSGKHSLKFAFRIIKPF